MGNKKKTGKFVSQPGEITVISTPKNKGKSKGK